MGSEWELSSAQDVAEALDWIRRRMKGRGLVIVAVGVNSVAYSKEADVKPEDAAELVAAQVPNLRKGFAQLRSHRVTRGASRREDV